MITISITIPSLPAQWILALTFVLSPLMLMSFFRLAGSAASVIRQMTKWIAPQSPGLTVLPLKGDRWMLEAFNGVIGTLQATAMVLLVFFVFALIGVVLMRIFESRAAKP